MVYHLARKNTLGDETNRQIEHVVKSENGMPQESGGGVCVCVCVCGVTSAPRRPLLRGLCIPAVRVP